MKMKISPDDKYSILIFGALLLCALLASSCAPQNHIDPEFRPYYDKFMTMATAHHLVPNVGITIQFDSSNQGGIGDYVAFCKMGEGYIGVVPDYWYSEIYSDEDDREEMIFHELGHCFLGREHDTNTFGEYAIPESIMYPDHFPPYLYDAFKPQYYEELFKYGQNCDNAGC